MTWALVTGGSSGIGRACAVALNQQGYNLILCGRRKERLLELAGLLPNQTLKCEIASFDIQDRAATETALAPLQENLSDLQVLINNAGLAKGTEKVQDAQFADWDAMIDTNVKGLLTMTRLVLPHMIKKQKGHIINMGSVAGRWIYPGGAIYCASKFAVRALSEGLRQDLIGTNLRVTNIEPGMVETEFSEVRFQDKDKAKQVYQDMRPLTPEDIAETVLWCLNRPAHVNIQELVIFPTDQPAVGQVHRRPNL